MAPPRLGPKQFADAVQWFRDRVPVTEEEWHKLEQKARRYAFKVAGATQLDLATQLHNSLTKAIAKKTPIEEWKNTVREQLVDAWGGEEIPGRLDTIFLTNIQTAYSAGRMKRLKSPSLRKRKPFWKSTPILDERTSPICRDIGIVIRPADDPYWKNNIPPLHFRCRRVIIGLSVDAAEAQGVTDELPEQEPQDGFGEDPSIAEWEPNLDDKPKELVKRYKAKR